MRVRILSECEGVPTQDFKEVARIRDRILSECEGVPTQDFKEV
jgi:hypothetical protein